MNKVTLSCPKCNRTFEHEQEVVAKRALGNHLQSAHGIRTERTQKEYDRRHGTRPDSAVEKMGAARWGDHKRKTKEQFNAERKAYYYAHQKEILARKREQRLAAKLAAKATLTPPSASPLSVDEASHRAELQRSAWWESETKKQIWCPCCGARFVVIQGSK